MRSAIVVIAIPFLFAAKCNHNPCVVAAAKIEAACAEEIERICPHISQCDLQEVNRIVEQCEKDIEMVCPESDQ